MPLIDCINAYDATTTCRKAQRLAFIVPSSLSLSWMVLNHGFITISTYFFSSSSNRASFVQSSTATEVTLSLIWKILNRWRSPALRPCNWSSCYARLKHSREWGIITCSRSYCAVSSLLAITTDGHQGSAIQGQLEKILKCQSHQRWSTLAENYDALYLFTKHVRSFFENTHITTLRNKRGIKNTILCHQNLGGHASVSFYLLSAL